MSWALVVSLAAAGGVHLAVGYEHGFAGVHGTFFVVAGFLQAIAAAAVARRPSRRVLGLVGMGSAVLLATWLVQRTPGLPGGDALDPLATAALAAEVVTVVAAIRLVGQPIARRGHLPGIASLALVALVAVGSSGFADDGHGDHHHPEGRVVSGATAQEPSSGPGPLRPLPVAPPGDHHGGSTDSGVADAEAVPGPPTEDPSAPASSDDHHDDEGAEPHDH